MNFSHLQSARRTIPASALALLASIDPTAQAEPFHKTSDAVGYKCIFNHELLIISHNKTNNAVNVQEANLP